MSPYLFLISAEGLSTLLNATKLNGEVRGVQIGRQWLAINYLLFADDCIIFGDASQEGATSVR